MELTCERLVNLTAGEVEAGETAIVRKAGRLELIGRRSHLLSAVSAFRSCDRMGSAASKAGEQLADRLSHAAHFKAAQHDDDGTGGGIMTYCAPPGLCAGRRSARRGSVVSVRARSAFIVGASVGFPSTNRWSRFRI